LVEGACKGEGLGNAFLHHVSVCHVLFHVVRGFKDISIEHVKGNVDPVRDMAIIATELRLKDLDAMEKRIAGYDRPRPFTGHAYAKTRKEELTIILKAREWLLRGRAIRHVPWTAAEAHFLGTLQMWTSKPAVYLLNVSQDDFVNNNNPHLSAVREWLATHSPESPVVPLSVQFEEAANTKREKEHEANQATATPTDKLVATTSSSATPDQGPKLDCEPDCEEVEGDEKIMVTGSGAGIVASVALTEMVQCGYRSVHLIHFFTLSERDGVAAYMIRQGTKAQEAAKKMHYDLDKLFVACEVYTFEDLVSLGSVANIRAAGKFRTCGKDYIVQGGDIIKFKFMPRSTLKKR
jgi:ribosome-binding ATPase YchF (GTP1/OBG family)